MRIISPTFQYNTDLIILFLEKPQKHFHSVGFEKKKKKFNLKHDLFVKYNHFEFQKLKNYYISLFLSASACHKSSSFINFPFLFYFSKIEKKNILNFQGNIYIYTT